MKKPTVAQKFPSPRRDGHPPALSVFALLLAAFLLSGCSARGSSSAAVETAAASAPMAPMAVSDAAASEQAAVTAAAGGIGGNTLDMPLRVSGDSQVSPADGAAEPEVSRKLIKNVSMNVETTEFDSLVSAIETEAEESGGYLEASEISGGNSSYAGSSGRHAYMTARIPSDRLNSFLDQVDQSGNVTSRSMTTTDVTLQYADTESRKKTLKAEQEKLWQLLEKADSLDAVIALESRLSEISYELESYESQLRLYDNQVDYSTVTLSIDEVKSLTPQAPDTLAERTGKEFMKSLRGVTDDIVAILIWLVSRSPYIAVLGLAAFAAFKLSKKLLRFLRKRREKDGRNSG